MRRWHQHRPMCGADGRNRWIRLAETNCHCGPMPLLPQQSRPQFPPTYRGSKPPRMCTGCQEYFCKNSPTNQGVCQKLTCISIFVSYVPASFMYLQTPLQRRELRNKSSRVQQSKLTEWRREAKMSSYASSWLFSFVYKMRTRESNPYIFD